MIDYKARQFLVEIGKALPFVVCAIVAICYMESIISTVCENYIAFEDGATALNTPVSFAIGRVFKYDWMLVFVLTVLSFAIRTCVWNKLCVLYLALQIFERQYFTTIDLYENQIISIATVNLIVCGFLIYKGFITLTKKV